MQNASTSGEPTNAALAWSIHITLRVLLSENDVSSLETPPPLYIQVPRQGYLYALLPKIKPLWQHVLPPEVQGAHAPWFSYNSLPLKWNVPVGALYDLLVPNHGAQPWQLTLHFTSFPSSTLLEYSGETSLQSSLFNSLKEACFIARNNPNPVMAMVSEAQNDLWRALSVGGGGNGGHGGNGGGSTNTPSGSINYSKYRDIMQSIPLISPNSLGAVPLRVFLRPQSSTSSSGAGGGGGDASYLSSYQNITFTSRPAPVADDQGRPMTLGTALTPILIAWLIDHNAWTRNNAKFNNESGISSEAQEQEGALTGGAAADEEEDSKVKAAWAEVDLALSGGIELHTDLILGDVHRDLHSPDFFLYIVLHMRPAQR